MNKQTKNKTKQNKNKKTRVPFCYDWKLWVMWTQFSLFSLENLWWFFKGPLTGSKILKAFSGGDSIKILGENDGGKKTKVGNVKKKKKKNAPKRPKICQFYTEMGELILTHLKLFWGKTVGGGGKVLCFVFVVFVCLFVCLFVFNDPMLVVARRVGHIPFHLM